MQLKIPQILNILNEKLIHAQLWNKKKKRKKD